MSRYLIRRLLLAIPTLLLISFVLFAILSLAPGDPLSQFAANPAVPPEVRENIRRSLGLDQPWPVRYVKWVIALAHGDWGFSFGSRIPVWDLIKLRIPSTLAVVGLAYLVSLVIAIPIGILSAVKQYSLFDHVATTSAFIGFSVPTFFTGLLLIIVFSVKLQWLPFIYDSTLQVHDLDSFGTQSSSRSCPSRCWRYSRRPRWCALLARPCSRTCHKTTCGPRGPKAWPNSASSTATPYATA